MSWFWLAFQNYDLGYHNFNVFVFVEMGLLAAGTGKFHIQNNQYYAEAYFPYTNTKQLFVATTKHVIKSL